MITLRDNQVRFDNEIRQALRSNHKVCAVAPTGFGKRIWACDAMCRAISKGNRVMLVTDRQILVRQAREECRQHDIPCGIIMSNEPRNDEAPIQICSLQTLESREWKDNPDSHLVIVDEAHKATSQYMRLIEQHPKAYVIGLTATPVGADDKLLLGLFDVVVEPVKNTELIRDGWLLPTKVMCPCEPDMKGVKIVSSSGEYSGNQAGERMQDMMIHADIWKWWKPYEEDQTIVFVPRLVFARWLVDEFVNRGHSAEIIEASTKSDERRDMFDRFASRETRVLVSVDVLREGFDAPISRVAMDLQPNAKLRTFWQKVGRIKRPYEGQDHAVLLDFAGNYWRHMHPDEDPEWPTDPTVTTGEILKKKKEGDQKEPWSCPVCCCVMSPWEHLIDGTCPGCGTIMGKAKRRVIMGDGKMQEVSAKVRKKRKSNTDVQAWFKCLYPAARGGYKLSFARHLYHRERGKWPDSEKLPMCPEPRSLEWGRKASDVYPQLVKKRKQLS